MSSKKVINAPAIPVVDWNALILAARVVLFSIVNTCYEYCVKYRTGWTGLFQNEVLGLVKFILPDNTTDQVGDTKENWSGPRSAAGNAPKSGQTWFAKNIGEPGGWRSYHECLVTVGHLVLQNVKGDSTSASKALRCAAIIGMIKALQVKIVGLELWIEKGGKLTCEFAYDDKYIQDVLLPDWQAFSASQKAYRENSPLMLALYPSEQAQASPKAAHDFSGARDL